MNPTCRCLRAGGGAGRRRSSSWSGPGSAGSSRNQRKGKIILMRGQSPLVSQQILSYLKGLSHMMDFDFDDVYG
jgi:hypothetical protein